MTTHEEKELRWTLGFILFIALMVGSWCLGASTVTEPEEVYVFESRQPVRPMFVEGLPESIDPESFTTTEEDREFIFYYWVIRTWDGYELRWTWREVTGP